MSDGRCIHCGQKGHYSMYVEALHETKNCWLITLCLFDRMCPKKPSSANTMIFNVGSGGGGGLNRIVNGKRKRFSFGKPTFWLSCFFLFAPFDWLVVVVSLTFICAVRKQSFPNSTPSHTIFVLYSSLFISYYFIIWFYISIFNIFLFIYLIHSHFTSFLLVWSLTPIFYLFGIKIILYIIFACLL